jgi:hypothetical protein
MMKTTTTSIPQSRHLHIQPKQGHFTSVVVSTREVLATLSAITAATAIVLLSVLAAGVEFTNIIAASNWALGFVFLALAVDNRNSKSVLQLLSGLALIGLAWLQANVSSDYSIASGVLVATWVAISLFRQLR